VPPRIELADNAALREINGWRYPPPYDLYNGDGEPVKNPERFYAVRDAAGQLVGFYYFELDGEVLKYGLGMRPDLTGRGLGEGFFRQGLEFGRQRFAPKRVSLDVASFNARAIRLYQRFGFREVSRLVRSLAGFGDVEFIVMDEMR
jgi:RimJ/RimL family protein N-acetyltransferase